MITLRGPSGPRFGSDMNQLHIVSGGALLIRNGVIQQAGTSRRIENLLEARDAREIDAKGHIVMPAFTSPDQSLVAPESSETRLAYVSRQRLEKSCKNTAAAYARVGSLIIGAHTGYAEDLRTANRILRIHHGVQSKPLRIRSILSPPALTDPDELIQKWLPKVARRKLAPILDINLAPAYSPQMRRREVAAVAATTGFALRVRTAGAPRHDWYELASDIGALAILSSYPAPPEWASRLPGCVHVVQAMSEAAHSHDDSPLFRKSLDRGWPVALASGATRPGRPVGNPQYLLHLAETRFGMTSEEAIVAATWNAACSLRMSHVGGSLEPGKAADLLIMDVPDYRELARRPGESDVHIAMSAGHIVYRRGGLILD